MTDPFTPDTFADTSAGGTPITAAKLNKIENALDQVMDNDLLAVAALTPATNALITGNGTSWTTKTVDQLVDPTPITANDLGLVSPQGVRAYANATAQTITNGAYPVYLDLNTVDFNENSALYTVDLTNNKLTVLTGGLYLVSWDVDFADSAGLREAYIAKNAGNAILSAAAGAGGQAGRTSPIRLAANDYLQVICYVEGGNVALTTNASHRCGLGLYRIGL